MFRVAMTLTAALLVASCADAGSSMDPALTSKYCNVLTAAQFKAAEANPGTIFMGSLNGIKVKALFKDDTGNLSMEGRGVIQLPSGTTIRIGEGKKAIFARAKQDTLIARGEGGPVCGPVS